jgi:amidophosphoribosyltransferase
MSDPIHHECGIALVRLLKPLEHYAQHYQTTTYGLQKLYLLLEKQHNRGQDGAGIANIKFDTLPGERYISRYRSNEAQALKAVFEKINNRFDVVSRNNPKGLLDPIWMKQNLPFTGELFLGHLRYGTYGGNSIESCHPFLRQNNWKSRNLVVAGNFNLTNVDELFYNLVALGQHPKERSDTVTVMERIGHFLDRENDRLMQHYASEGLSLEVATERVAQDLDLVRILQDSSKKWDGGYVMAGLLGHGDAFVLRDPNGIRPCYYYMDDEVLVVASERPAIQTAFNLKVDQVLELPPGEAIICKRNGMPYTAQVNPAAEKTACSFERIYFSRGSDADIYRERKALGEELCDSVLSAINSDWKNTVFSYIPNTAETAFLGLLKGMETRLLSEQLTRLVSQPNKLSEMDLSEIVGQRLRVEKLAIKDAKLRTFITNDQQRNDLVAHVYDVTYGTVRPGIDQVVVVDDSIVRGTTLKQSILRMLDRLEPSKIVVVSSAPQIRYPDCYGIDMAKLSDFIAFQAVVSLVHKRGMQNLLEEVEQRAVAALEAPQGTPIENAVKALYAPFSDAEVCAEIASLLTPEGLKAKVEVVFQTLDGLHQACPNHRGDWYFSGNYPTAGGMRVVNRAFLNYRQGNTKRAY